MLARNLFFFAICAGGLAMILWRLAPGGRAIAPRDHAAAQYQRDEFRTVVDQLNAEFRQQWKAEELAAAERAEDLTIARRISLGLTGTIPSLEEIRAFESQPAAGRVQWWLSHLLEDRRSADYLAERLARAYVGVEDGPFLVYRRRRFVTWLSDQLHENVPYDQLVRQLIADEGLWTDAPAVNFLTVTLDQNADNQPDEVKLAARVSKAFLGVRIDCVECHDDNLGGDWKQSDFHQLAAFFSGARRTLTGIRDREPNYRYQYLGEEKAKKVRARAPFNKQLLPSDGVARERLAGWVTSPENRPFARAMVNRMWALLAGRPLLEPIDNIPLEGPHPPALEALADDFIAHQFDLRRLIRVIVATEAYQRDSQADFAVTAEHERHWAVFPLVRLRPDQVAGALLQSASLKTIDADSHIIVKLARLAQQNDFVRRYGDTGEDEFNADGGTIPQRLLMLNGQLVKERTKDDLIANASTRIAQLAPGDEQAVEAAYLTILSRRPTLLEREHFVARLDGARDKGSDKARTRQMEDLCWTLLNSAEFSWNH